MPALKLPPAARVTRIYLPLAMNVIGLCGFSGSGKTTLAERLIAELRAAGRRVSVVKHAHHSFDIDHEGKDSWRHRQAGASEVVIGSDRRLAKIREFEVRADPTVHDLLAELAPCDWVLVEGFKLAALPKIEVWRAANGKPARYLEDPHVVAVATDDPRRLPAPTALPVLDLNDAAAVAAFLLADPDRYVYLAPAQGGEAAPAGVARVAARALRGSGRAEVEERVADEVPIAIEVDGLARLLVFATPADLEDLVLGYLLGDGIVDGAGDLLAFDTEERADGLVLRARISAASAGRLAQRAAAAAGAAGPDAAAMLAAAERGVGRRVEPVEIDYPALVAGMRALAAGQGLWKSTGASHAAAWMSLTGESRLVREDVGRRNALDKLVGAMARAGVAPASGFAAVTSRVSHDMVHQAAQAGIGVLAAISAPTALAIRVAEAAGIVLVGFARGDSAALYTYPDRVRRKPG
ncbi:MAG: formate dehydrogenase accessory sulfurtransferase FdhD [Burkholderiales bacterium]|nr:formate dehydrogenase accessory sulfurtransferase FdhD [Burkholderiales bacterium]